MFSRLKFVFYYIKGKKFLLKSNIAEALSSFTKASNYNKDDYDLYAYKGLCEFLLKQFESSIVSYQHALILVNKKKQYNSEEKEYLRHYVLENLLHSLKILRQNMNIEKYESLLRNLNYDKKNIRERILRDFPL